MSICWTNRHVALASHILHWPTPAHTFIQRPPRPHQYFWRNSAVLMRCTASQGPASTTAAPRLLLSRSPSLQAVCTRLHYIRLALHSTTIVTLLPEDKGCSQHHQLETATHPAFRNHEQLEHHQCPAQTPFLQPQGHRTPKAGNSHTLHTLHNIHLLNQHCWFLGKKSHLLHTLQNYHKLQAHPNAATSHMLQKLHNIRTLQAHPSAARTATRCRRCCCTTITVHDRARIEHESPEPLRPTRCLNLRLRVPLFLRQGNRACHAHHVPHISTPRLIHAGNRTVQQCSQPATQRCTQVNNRVK